MTTRIGASQYAVLHTAIAEGLDRLAQTGIPGLELFMEGAAWWHPEAIRAVEQARPAFAGTVSIHPPAWDVNMASYTGPVREMSIRIYREAIDIAQRLRAAYVVLHVGWRGAACFPAAEYLARAEDAIRPLVPDAREAGVRIAVENVGWLGSEICDQAEFTALIHRLPEGAGALLDVGHARLAGWDLDAALRDLAPRMIAVHLHDNNGRSDQHLPIGQGLTDWASVLPALDRMPAECTYVLEYAPGTAMELLRQGADLVSRHLAGVPG